VHLLGTGFELKVQPGFTHTCAHQTLGVWKTRVPNAFKNCWIDNFELLCIKHFGLNILL